MQVSLWMTPKPFCVSSEDKLDTVAEALNAGGFRRAPVIDADGRLLGIVTDRDLREHKGYLSSSKVSAAMTEPALAVTAGDPIERAAELLLAHKIGGLPVVDEQQRVVGVITETDLLCGFLDATSPGEGAVRVDFACGASAGVLGAAVHAVEAAGGTVLGAGTFQPSDRGGERRYYLRFVTAAALEPVLDSLRRYGCEVTAIHRPRPAEAA
ncbi:MAG: CBS domain-containing protein [Candidatus Binatia bacterium]